MAAASRHNSVLREMGLGPIWRLRTANDVADAEVVTVVEVVSAPDEPRQANPEMPSPLPAVRAPRPAGTLSAARPQRASVEPAGAMAPAIQDRKTPMVDAGRAARIATLEWDALEEDIRGCKACSLCERRKQAVPGVGDRRAELMLVGEGPGAEEDQRGEPFVGQAGKLLDNMLTAIGLKRGEGVYIANAVKCRPPHNRTPETGEIAACLPYLERQIALVRPRLLVALGRPAAQALLASEVSIGAARGKRFERGEVPVVVTYHPAYLLRNPQDKAKAWEDLCFVRRTLETSAKG